MKLKCEMTGKITYPSKVEALERMVAMRRHCRYLSYGRRRKHRQVKPAFKRAYYCEHCNGYHLTRLVLRIHKKRLAARGIKNHYSETFQN